MKQSITQRLNSLVFSTIKPVAINQPFECDVTSTFAPQLNENGQMVGLSQHWLVTVAIPNPLQNNVQIATSIPIGGVLPPDEIFEKVAVQLFDSCMQQKQKVLTPPDAMPLVDTVPTAPRVGPKPTLAPIASGPSEPVKPKRSRERESHFPSKPGSGQLSADN